MMALPQSELAPSSARPLQEPPEAALGSAIGEFELVSHLGRGGMADVYVGRHSKTGARAAIKRMLPWLVKQRRFVELFFHEARVYASLSHPNIVRCIDVGLDGAVPFMVLELADGFACHTLLRSAGAFPLGVAVTVAHQVLEGLSHAHEARDRQGRALGVVHNDVAPDNVVICRSGQVKLVDFGIAHSLLAGGPMKLAELRGKIGYVSPEHLAGTPTDARTDVFSVGALLAELLIGRPLFAAGSTFQVTVASFNVDESALRCIDLHVPDPLKELLQTALSRDRERRFASARDFSRALEEAAGQLTRSLDVGQIRDWLARSGFPPEPRGPDEGAGTPRAPELHGRIDVLREAIEERTPTSRVGGEVESRSIIAMPQVATERYQVQFGLHAEVTKLTHAEVVAAIVTRRLGARSLIAATAEPWISLGDVPGFSVLFERPAHRRELGPPAWEAPLERSKLPGVLFQIASARETGALEARCGTAWKRIFFDEGTPVLGASNDAAELLGNCVRRMGVVTSRELDQLVSVAFFQGRRLGDVIVGAKLMNPAEMLRVLVRQLESRVLELGDWTSGELSFFRGARPGLSAPKPLGSPVSLPCSLVRTSYCDAEVAAFLGPLADEPIRVSGSVSALASVLTRTETDVLQRFTVPQSLPSVVSSLATPAGPKFDEVNRAVFLGLSAGVLECDRSLAA